MTLTRTAGALTSPPAGRSALARPRRERPAMLPTAVLLLGAAYCLLPVAWVLVASTKSTAQLFNTYTFAPDGSLWSNIRGLSAYAGGVYWKWMANTALYAGGGALLSTLVSALTGYALAKYEFRGKQVLFNLLLAGVMVPPVVLALPQYLLMAKVGLSGTYWSVLLPSILSPYGIYLARIYAMSAVPDEVIESARVDGCPEGRLFARIAVPMMVPGLVTVCLFQFVAVWNNFLLPFIMLSDQNRFPITVGLYTLLDRGSTAPALYNLVVTGVLLSIIPLVILFLALQRYWRTDLASGAVKQLAMNERRRPTIEDVAAEAGVSRGTVSRVLNGGHYVSPATLDAVNRAIKKTAYVVNQHARSLVTQRSESVAFILSEPAERLFADPNFAVLLRGCTQALAEHDIGLFVWIASSASERTRVTRFLAAGHVDGALLVSAHAGDPLLDLLGRARVPCVAIGAPLGHESQASYVAADDRSGARTMVAYLRSLGRTRVATVTGPLDTSGGRGRLEGYRDVLGAGFEDSLVEEGDYSQPSGERAMTRLLERRPDLDAVFVASDVMALGALVALRRADRRVPEDVAVGGFDDSSAALAARPALTTIRQPWQRISREMVRLLLASINGEEPAAVILPTELVRRESA